MHSHSVSGTDDALFSAAECDQAFTRLCCTILHIRQMSDSNSTHKKRISKLGINASSKNTRYIVYHSKNSSAATDLRGGD